MTAESSVGSSSNGQLIMSIRPKCVAGIWQTSAACWVHILMVKRVG